MLFDETGVSADKSHRCKILFFLSTAANLLATIFDKPCGVNISGKTISLSCKKIDENVTRHWTSGLYRYKPGIVFSIPKEKDVLFLLLVLCEI